MYFLLWVTILNQSQVASQVVKNTKKLIDRIGEKRIYSDLTFHEIFELMNTPPKLHRFPRKMADYIYDSLWIINNSFNGDIGLVFEGGDIKKNLMAFKGISTHKAEMCLGLLYCIEHRCFDMQRFRGCKVSESVLFDEIEVINSLKNS